MLDPKNPPLHRNPTHAPLASCGDPSGEWFAASGDHSAYPPHDAGAWDRVVVVLPVVGAPVADLVGRMRQRGLRVVVDDRPERLVVRLRDANARYVVLVRSDGVIVQSSEGRRQVSADECLAFLG